MKLIDLDAEKDYLLDGKYKVKAGTDYVPIDEEWERGYTAGQMAERQEQHGHWIDAGADLDGAYYYRCSVCGNEAVDGYEYPRCPYCGAKMNGKEQENE